ncbi:MAG: hypothetical protein AABZ53_02835 [Planctomycetota bacterium]
MTHPLINSFKSLPRAGKWGLAALAGIAAYFLVVEPSVSKAVTLADKAATKETALQAWSKDEGPRKNKEAAVALGSRIYGNVSFPMPEAEGSPATLTRIAAVLKKQGVRQYDLRERPMVLKSPVLTAATGGSQIKRIVRDLTFECRPEVLSALLAELEKSPEISSVSRLSIGPPGSGRAGNTGGGGKTIKVTISVESWVQARENKG